MDDPTTGSEAPAKPKRTLVQKLIREIRRPFTRRFRERLMVKYGWMPPKPVAPELPQPALPLSALPPGATEAEIRAIRAVVPCLAGSDAPVAMIIDDRLPEPDRDSGSLDAVNMIACLAESGYHVVVGTESGRPQDGKYADLLRASGARPVTMADAPDLDTFIRRYGGFVDLFILSRVGAGGVYLELIRALWPDARIVFNTVDLHYVREVRAARATGDAEALAQAEHTRDREEFLAGRSDLTLLVSSVEEEVLQASVPGCRTLVLPLARPIHPPQAPFESRSGIGFIGGFEHRPNVDAVRHFLASVWPLVQAGNPAIRFEIVGASLPEDMLDGLPGDVRYLGTLDSIDGWLESLRMTVAPLRIGAGAKGKVASSLCAGLPCVLTGVAAEGMGLVDGRDVLIADDPAAMAAKILRLHDDPETWAHLSAGALAFARERLSVANYKRVLRRAIVALDLPADALPAEARSGHAGDPSAAAAGPGGIPWTAQ